MRGIKRVIIKLLRSYIKQERFSKRNWHRMQHIILSLYRYVCSRTKSKDKDGPLKDSAGNVIDDDKGIVTC